MTSSRSRFICLASGLAAFALVGCSAAEDEARAPAASVPAASGASAAGGAPTAAAPAVTDTTATCPERGDWQLCSVEKRLERAGLVIERGTEPVRHDFLQVPGVKYETSRAELQVFLYPSEAARARDTDALDTIAVAPRGRRLIWRWPATLVTSGNLVAIILSLNERQAERIALALGAGLPPVLPRGSRAEAALKW